MKTAFFFRRINIKHFRIRKFSNLNTDCGSVSNHVTNWKATLKGWCTLTALIFNKFGDSDIGILDLSQPIVSCGLELYFAKKIYKLDFHFGRMLCHLNNMTIYTFLF